MGIQKKRRATYKDLLALPDNVVGEIVDGELHVSPRPASLHAFASSRLGALLARLGSGGGGGGGGWWLIFEPELHFAREVLVPDLAGWRVSRMPAFPDVPFFTLAPDWICEVLSPTTARLDLVRKLPKYARAGVGHAWVVDPRNLTLQVFRRAEGTWTLCGSFAGDDLVRAEPFEDVELALGELWPTQAREATARYTPAKRRPSRASPKARASSRRST